MQEILAIVFDHLRGIWRYRWYALLVAWLVSLAGWLYIQTLPDFYETYTKVQVNTESLLEPLLEGLAIQTDTRSKVDMMTRALLTRPNLERLVRETDLDLRAKTEDAANALINRLRRDIRITPGRHGDNVYTIAYSDQDAQMTQRVVKALLDLFVENSLGSERKESSNAQRFLEEQIQSYETRLVAAEQRLADFKKKHVGMMPNEGQDYYMQLQSDMKQLARTRGELKVVENRRRELRKQLEGEEPVFGLVSSRLTDFDSDPLASEIREYRNKLDDLALRYTEKHPDIIAIRGIIADLENRRQQPTGLDSVGTQPLEMNPVYQSMKIALSEVEVEVAALRTKVADQANRVDELKEKIDTIPEVEAKLKRLNRDYEVTRQQYNALILRLEKARLSGEAEERSENVEFQIIDPPLIPQRPAGPDRRLFNTVVLVGGLLAGAALSFFLHQIHPVFSNSKTAHNLTGFPVLGEVTLKLQPTQKVISNIEMASFLFATALLGIAYGSVLVFEGSLTHQVVELLKFASKSAL